MKGKRVESGLEVSAFRLARHHLAGKAPAEPSAICHDVCGIQAQVMSAAEIALWARNHELTRPAIHSALWESRTLVKTALMRGTLHLVAAKDFPIYIAALRTSRVRQALQIMARYGVSENEARAVGEAVIEMLCGGPMTRKELTRQVLALGIAGKKSRPWFEQSSWGVMRLPMTEGLVCYGPNRGPEVALIRTDRWLGGQKPVGEQEALRILIRRYLSAYGPADSRDFSKWSGLPASEVRPIWHSLEKDFIVVDIPGMRGFMLREDAKALGNRDPECGVLRLLPSFDAYMLGHFEKQHLVEARYYKRVFRDQWWISPAILLDGRVIGTWATARGKKNTVFTAEPFEKLSKSNRARIEAEVASLARFLQTPYEIKWEA